MEKMVKYRIEIVEKLDGSSRYYIQRKFWLFWKYIQLTEGMDGGYVIANYSMAVAINEIEKYHAKLLGSIVKKTIYVNHDLALSSSHQNKEL